jgi:hypothetical protein
MSQPSSTPQIARKTSNGPSQAANPTESLQPPEGPGAQPELGGAGPDETEVAATEQLTGSDHQVGYGKPPLHSRFQKGQSGNPSGRPAGRKRLTDLFAEELHRLVSKHGAPGEEQISALQAVIRAQFKLAADGDGPAQRAFLNLAKELAKQELEAEEKQLEAEEKRKASEQAAETKAEAQPGRCGRCDPNNPLALAVEHFEKALETRYEGYNTD